MDVALLKDWLGLPESSGWPPDPHVLLGLPPGPADPAAAESRALDRMDTLRAYQLLHPELVTEGMTRLAQALITVTDAPPPAPAPVYDLDPEPLPTAPPFEVVELPPAPTPPPDASGPRWVYRRLAAVRRAARAWDRVGAVLADPEDACDTPARVMVLLEAVRAARPALDVVRGIMGGVGEPGGVAAAVVRQPLVLDTFRRLLPDQRRAVAADWRRGREALAREHAWLRRVAAKGRAVRARRRYAAAAWRWARDTPELVLVPLALLYLALRRG